MGCIWLIGGTQDSKLLAEAIAQFRLSVVITVTTASAHQLYAALPYPELRYIRVGQLSASDMEAFLAQYNISCIVDASHPFAIEISHLAIAIAHQCHLPYLRYERPTVAENDHSNFKSTLVEQVFSSLDAFLSSQQLVGQRALLTLGYRYLDSFRPWQDKATLFARILPSLTALEAALAAGFTPDRMIALRPPISLALEKALWQSWNISMVVTKASGHAGGELTKRQAAAELGVQLITLARPAIAYPQQTSDLQTALEFCKDPALDLGHIC